MTDDSKRTVFICRGTGCESSKSDVLHEMLVDEVKKQKLEKKMKTPKKKTTTPRMPMELETLL